MLSGHKLPGAIPPPHCGPQTPAGEADVNAGAQPKALLSRLPSRVFRRGDHAASSESCYRCRDQRALKKGGASIRRLSLPLTSSNQEDNQK
jgi:hypothetical protein